MKHNSLDCFFLPPRAQNPGDGPSPKIVPLFVMGFGGPLTCVSFDPAPHFLHWFWKVRECGFFTPVPSFLVSNSKAFFNSFDKKRAFNPTREKNLLWMWVPCFWEDGVTETISIKKNFKLQCGVPYLCFGDVGQNWTPSPHSVRNRKWLTDNFGCCKETCVFRWVGGGLVRNVHLMWTFYFSRVKTGVAWKTTVPQEVKR